MQQWYNASTVKQAPQFDFGVARTAARVASSVYEDLVRTDQLMVQMKYRALKKAKKAARKADAAMEAKSSLHEMSSSDDSSDNELDRTITAELDCWDEMLEQDCLPFLEHVAHTQKSGTMFDPRDPLSRMARAVRLQLSH